MWFNLVVVIVVAAVSAAVVAGQLLQLHLVECQLHFHL